MDVKQAAADMIDAVKSHVARAVDPLASRVATLEFKAGALAMSMARDPAQRAQLADTESLLQRIDSLESRLTTLEGK